MNTPFNYAIKYYNDCIPTISLLYILYWVPNQVNSIEIQENMKILDFYNFEPLLLHYTHTLTALITIHTTGLIFFSVSLVHECQIMKMKKD